MQAAAGKFNFMRLGPTAQLSRKFALFRFSINSNIYNTRDVPLLLCVHVHDIMYLFEICACKIRVFKSMRGQGGLKVVIYAADITDNRI